MRPALGIYTLTIDVWYAWKLSGCEIWDHTCRPTAFGLPSAVESLNVCYLYRRPWFELTDTMCVLTLIPRPIR